MVVEGKARPASSALVITFTIFSRLQEYLHSAESRGQNNYFPMNKIPWGCKKGSELVSPHRPI